jgi:hypothetical protein
MPSRRESAAAALRSQRRFLILVSIALAAYYVLAVHIKGEGEYSGFAMKLGRPDRIPYVLWVIFTWALLRYWQRLHEQWRIVRTAVMQEFEYCDHQLVLKAARRSAVQQVKRRQLGKDLRDPFVVGDVQVTDSVKEMMGTVMAQRARAQGKPVPKREPDPWFTVKDGKRVYRAFAIGVAGADQTGLTMGYDFAIPPWSRVRTLVHQLRAWVRTALRLPAVLEYLAPLAIAMLAVVLAVIFRES